VYLVFRKRDVAGSRPRNFNELLWRTLHRKR
jgi:hypothetical protein